jgi:hypothetical protein
MLISQPFTDSVSQSANPALQLYPHAVPLHVALAFAGIEQAVHDDVPQVAVLLLLTHRPAQLWKPALQVNPHVPAEQVAVPFAGTGQTVLHVPQ